MNVNKLKCKIVERGENVEVLADKIGVDRATMYRKLNSFEKVTIGEASRIKAALGLTSEEATENFLD